MIVSVGSLLKGIVYGAGVMYFLDPERGRRRRARIRDRAIGFGNDLHEIWDKGSRDLANRAAGVASETRRALDLSPVDDEQLTQRVRSVLGHCITDAKAVEVQTNAGFVTLRGHMRPGEPERALPSIERISGVRGVESALNIQGSPVGPVFESRAMRPGTRLLMTAGGGLLLLNGLSRHGFMPKLLGSFGVGMLAQGLSNPAYSRLGSSGRRGIECRGSILIQAPVEKVFEFVSDVEQSGRFLPKCVNFETLGNGRMHWTFEGPAGIGALQCDEIQLDSVENERLVWASTDSSPLRYLGEARFQEIGEATRLDVALIYAPPGGAVTHAAAQCLGLDPKTFHNQSLARIKQCVEAGTIPAAMSQDKGHNPQHG